MHPRSQNNSNSAPATAAAASRNGSGPLSPTARRTVTFRWDRGRRARRMGRGTFRRRSIARRVFDADDLVGVVELCGLSSRRLSLPLSYPVVGAGGFFSSSSSSLTGLGEELALSPAAPACVLSSLIHLPRHVEAGTSSYALALLWIFLAADACLFPSPGFVTEDCTVPATYVSNR
ncbi:hypothetical protein DFJ73DRAFT_140212 [Zopfochytrium polystomum]|nr:hypothetical protein DFJ73DRAFT_140212 [Zopfochytrium polystomum]